MSEKKSNSAKTGTEVQSAGEQTADAGTVVKQKLFILKAKAKNLKNAEQFLKNRDFEIVSTTDMKIAISTILGGHASIIMLSTDHSNPKVMQLPKIIQSSFNTPIIIFSEGVSPKGAAALRESRHPYILYPPVSGPAVERMILKIERDRKEKAEAEASGGKAHVAADNQQDHSTMKFSGTNRGSHDDIIMQSKRAEQEFNKIFSNDSPVDSNTSVSDYEASGDSDTAVSDFGPNSRAYTPGLEAEDGDDAEVVLNYLNKETEGEAADTPEFSGSAGTASGRQDNNSESAGGFSDGLEDAHEDSPQKPGIGLPKFVGMNKKGDMVVGQNAPNIQSEDNASAFIPTGTPNSHMRKGIETPDNELTAAEILAKKGVNLLTFKSDDNASFLIKGTKHAIENSSRFIQGSKVSKIQSCTKVSCFNLESTKFSGYVIVAFGEKDKIDEQFNKNIQSYLAEYLKINGLEVKTADISALKIKEVNFEEWSIREADFLMTTIHEGSEIALAFFPHEKKEAPLELSAQASMAKMTIDEIKADEPVEFDIYIYLPTNAKYVRYTPQNGIMYSNQKDRLKSKGHAKIHIRKESESDLSRYRVQNFLNEKIESFKRSKRAV